MPKYKLRYLVETPIRNTSDLGFTYDEHLITFCFSKRGDKEIFVNVKLEVEAENANEAQMKASGTLIPLVLNALAFTTGAPLLLHECDLILKSEPGVQARKALYVNVSRLDIAVPISSKQVAESHKILGSASSSTLPMCWHRYAAHRGYALDRFLFQWLALEGLAGNKQIETPCPKCGHVRTHDGTDKNKAYELFRVANPNMSKKEFDTKV
jgi:hypothetical protein